MRATGEWWQTDVQTQDLFSWLPSSFCQECWHAFPSPSFFSVTVSLSVHPVPLTLLSRSLSILIIKYTNEVSQNIGIRESFWSAHQPSLQSSDASLAPRQTTKAVDATMKGFCNIHTSYRSVQKWTVWLCLDRVSWGPWFIHKQEARERKNWENEPLSCYCDECLSRPSGIQHLIKLLLETPV